ncbi:palindromic element RPE1 domain-containing protein [Candidatus Tisiphia endosymbiont of Thecophora atra]|uniref:palindromic element RPE1 domain-containing protein n=1 Tax=Candidatus Tisiphia endosymbiont of Thecophora atra TaxID=3066258 RepID=UPI00312C811F
MSIQIHNIFKKQFFKAEEYIRLPAEFAFAEEFVGDTEPRPAAYSNVREDSSTGITHKLPAKVELCRKSINIKANIA